MSIVIRGDRCRCNACGEFFNSSAAFTKHRIGAFAPINKPDTRRCRTPEEMTSKGMARNAAGLWVSALNPKFARVA